MSDCAEGGCLASPQEIEWSPQKQTKETRGVRMGAGRRNQGQCKALTSRDTKEDTTAQGGAKGRRTALLEVLCLDISLGQSPPHLSEPRWSSPCVGSAICGLLDFLLIKCRVLFPLL